MGIVRVLFLADTHLGFDLAFRPRIESRRHGPEFFANFQRALQPALDGRVDCVVHGGDLLFRSKVPASSQAMKILSAGALRALAPQTMNIDAVFVEEQKLKRYPSTKSNQST